MSEQEARLRATVQEEYRTVSRDPRGHFAYPIGRESLIQLGYASEWLAAAPPAVAEWFVGVGNPFSVRPVERGERVLDVALPGKTGYATLKYTEAVYVRGKK